MRSWLLSAEAEHCRLLAADLAGRPEAAFLLRLAEAFDALSREREASSEQRRIALDLAA